MPRFFLDPAEWAGESALSGEEAKHCARVMRAKVGDVITVFDGEGRSAVAKVLNVSRDRIRLCLGEVITESAPKVEIVLAQAVLKGKAMDWLLQKAVELGVSSIQPLSTRHAVVQPGEGKEEKWQRVAVEACKQCGRGRVPKVLPVLGFQEFVKKTTQGIRVIASLEAGAKPLKACLAGLADPQQMTILVGPEGDFTPQEYAESLKAGYIPANLGPAVLRSETAAIYCLAAATYALS